MKKNEEKIKELETELSRLESANCGEYYFNGGEPLFAEWAEEEKLKEQIRILKEEDENQV